MKAAAMCNSSLVLSKLSLLKDKSLLKGTEIHFHAMCHCYCEHF